jgi:hypothetical protein
MAVTNTTSVRRQPQAVRRFGYVVGVVFNAAALFVINAWPGWDALPFLTDDASQILGIVNLMLSASLAFSLVYLFGDPPWLLALGGLTTSALGLIATVRIWRVFPFEFGDSSIDWALLFRIALVIGVVGSCIAMAVQLVTLVRAVVRRA